MIKWSFSSLKQFKNCPRQYHEVKVLKNYTIQDTSYTTYGKAVHKALEEYARDQKPLPFNYERFRKVVGVLLAIDGERYVEHELALRIDHTPCKFDAPDYWVRGIIDLLIIDGDTAFIVDYKTGSDKYPDMNQLKLMSLLVFCHFPDVRYVKAGLLFLLKDRFIDDTFFREKMDEYWESFWQVLRRIEMAHETGKWSKNPSGLCRFCPVDTCEFHKD
jgi:RecB family exonuclease